MECRPRRLRLGTLNDDGDFWKDAGWHARWWQLKYFFIFIPNPGGDDPIWLAHIFQMGIGSTTNQHVAIWCLSYSYPQRPQRLLHVSGKPLQGHRPAYEPSRVRGKFGFLSYHEGRFSIGPLEFCGHFLLKTDDSGRIPGKHLLSGQFVPKITSQKNHLFQCIRDVHKSWDQGLCEPGEKFGGCLSGFLKRTVAEIFLRKYIPWKLTCPLKINGWKMYSLLK